MSTSHGVGGDTDKTLRMKNDATFSAMNIRLITTAAGWIRVACLNSEFKNTGLWNDGKVLLLGKKQQQHTSKLQPIIPEGNDSMPHLKWQKLETWGLLVPVGVKYEALQQTGRTAEDRGRKGGRADLTHNDWARALKQKLFVIRLEILTTNLTQTCCGTCRGCGAELICGGGGVAKTSEVGCPGP